VRALSPIAVPVPRDEQPGQRPVRVS